MQQQMDFSTTSCSHIAKYYAFGGETPEDIYEYICSVADNSKYIILNRNKTGNTISIFDSVEFRIRINRRTQCLDTENATALEYVSSITGASVTKGTAHFPLITDEVSIPVVKEMIQCVYVELRSRASGKMFGCCNSYVQCSDARQCLHQDDREYWGCCYKRNLEAGRIFYGKNKNI